MIRKQKRKTDRDKIPHDIISMILFR